jgi:hypothetical protein
MKINKIVKQNKIEHTHFQRESAKLKEKNRTNELVVKFIKQKKLK